MTALLVIFVLVAFLASASALAANSADLMETGKYSLLDQRPVSSRDFNSTRK
jgi:hypothetical protein